MRARLGMFGLLCVVGMAAVWLMAPVAVGSVDGSQQQNALTSSAMMDKDMAPTASPPNTIVEKKFADQDVCRVDEVCDVRGNEAMPSNWMDENCDETMTATETMAPTLAQNNNTFQTAAEIDPGMMTAVTSTMTMKTSTTVPRIDVDQSWTLASAIKTKAEVTNEAQTFAPPAAPRAA